MFKDLYKQANEDIKGDRVILEKAFEMAAKPEKKKLPLMKLSYVGTAVAAVIVIGAVFVNSQIFTSKVEIVKPEIEKETEASVTTAGIIEEETEVMLFDFDETKNENSVALSNADLNTPVGRDEAMKRADTQSEAAEKSFVGEQSAEINDDVTAEETAEDGIAVTFMAEESIDAIETVEEETEAGVFIAMTVPETPEEAVATWGLRDRSGINSDEDEEWEEDAIANDGVWEEVSESDGEAPSEESGDKKAAGGGSGGSANTVPQFSYMYDLSCDYYAKTEGFVNVEVSPVTNRAEAIKRAEKEYNGEYDGVDVYYDPIECVWKVVFWCDDAVASEFIVYINSDGITLMIVNLA